MGFNPPILQARLTVDDQLVRLSALFFPSFLQKFVDNRIHWRLIDPIYPDISFP